MLLVSTDYFYTLSAILDSLCKEFLAVNVSAILYLMNHEQYGRSTASAQYFLQLAGYLGIPVNAFLSLSMHLIKLPIYLYLLSYLLDKRWL